MARQKTEEAAEVLEKARTLAPRDLSVQFLLGVAYFALERYDQAEGPLTNVLNERPQTEGVGYYVGLIRYRKKDYQARAQGVQGRDLHQPERPAVGKVLLRPHPGHPRAHILRDARSPSPAVI